MANVDSNIGQHGFKGQCPPGGKGKFMSEIVLEQPCRFHTTPGRQATSTKDCIFLKDLKGGSCPMATKIPKWEIRISRKRRKASRSSLPLDRKRRRGTFERVVNATVSAVPQWLNQSEHIPSLGPLTITRVESRSLGDWVQMLTPRYKATSSPRY